MTTSGWPAGARQVRRVLMTADAVGGVWPYALHLCALLAARGVRVLLATMGPQPSSSQRDEAAAIAGLDLRTSTYALEWMPHPWADVDRATGWLLELETQFAPDVVHVNGYAHGAIPWAAPALVVGHSCVSSWWTAVHGSPPPESWAEYVRRVRDGLAGAQAIATPTAAMGAALQRLYGLDRQVIVIPNSVGPAADPPDARKAPIVFAAGRVWDPAKNLVALDRAASTLSWPVYVAGDAASPDGTAARLNRVHVLGRIPSGAVRQWMGQASIYALPARYEPFGLSVLEAALSGCALVLGDIESLRENWDGAARFVPPEDDEALRHTLQTLIDDSPARLALAAAARARAARFAPAAHVAAYARLYEDMVAAHDRTARPARAH